MSLGLNTPMTLGLIILPQALKICHPRHCGAVHQPVSGYDPARHRLVWRSCWVLAVQFWPTPTTWADMQRFIYSLGVIYWIFCYAMSLGSHKIEQKLNTEG